MADLNVFNVRQKYSHFRILVIGRANAGKTTLLKRVCNTTEDPRIYNEGTNLVRFLSSSERNDTLTVPGQLAGTNLSGDYFAFVTKLDYLTLSLISVISMISIAHSSLRETRSSYSMTLQGLRLEMRVS